jgi:hypothetical protein
MRGAALALAAVMLLATPAWAAPTTVLWAWERPEDLRAAPPGAEVAVMVAFVELSGDGLWARARRFRVLTAPDVRRIAMVHVQIDPRRPLVWTPELRARAAAAVLAFAQPPGYQGVQIDFEVRASERQALIDVVHDVRAALPPGIWLSMTALASWCETETWLADVPADEIVPMAFRMGHGGAAIRDKLDAGGDFAEPRCRSAIGVSLAGPQVRAPSGRRVYIFDPHSWTAEDLADAARRSGG